MKTKEPKLLKLEIGKCYRTYGGWKALIIWERCKQISVNEMQPYYSVIHKPKEESESNIISHDYNGRAESILSVGEPPQYTEHHPADLKELWK